MYASSYLIEGSSLGSRSEYQLMSSYAVVRLQNVKPRTCHKFSANRLATAVRFRPLLFLVEIFNCLRVFEGKDTRNLLFSFEVFSQFPLVTPELVKIETFYSLLRFSEKLEAAAATLPENIRLSILF